MSIISGLKMAQKKFACDRANEIVITAHKMFVN